MPDRRRQRRRLSASRRSTRPPGWNSPVSRPRPGNRSSRLVPGDVSDSFPLTVEPAALLDDARVEPMPASVALAPSGPAPPGGGGERSPRSRNRVVTPGLLVSFALHLSPLLLLVTWSSMPADITPPPIPVQVVFQAPPPSPAPEKAPPRGRLA